MNNKIKEKEIKIKRVELKCKGKTLVFDEKNLIPKHKSFKGFLEYLDELLLK